MRQRSTNPNVMQEYRATPAKSTLRYAKVRAKHSGVYYGRNINLTSMRSWKFVRTTRGSVVG